MSRRHSLLAIAVCLIGAALSATPASAKPNFSGSWKLVADKSDFGPMPVPEKYEQVVDHQDPDVSVKTKQVGQQGEIETDVKYNTEGKETTNTLRGNPLKSVAKWEGDALQVDSKLNFQGNEITLTDKWVLSEDGKVFTIDRKLVTPQGELEMKLVLEKQ
jgi:hypothetical protein